MNSIANLNRNWLILALPILLLTGLWLLICSKLYLQHEYMPLAVTVDLIITVPILYFLLVRKTSIPNITVLPVMVLGLALGTLILPEEDQLYLSLFKSWGLPFIEIAVLALVMVNVRRAVLRYQDLKTPGIDFFTAVKSTTSDLFPSALAPVVATEIAVIYYTFMKWRHTPLNEFEFSYHKTSSSRVLFTLILFLLVVETLIFHLLLTQWSLVAAWVVTGISIYAFLQILAFSKSISHRPIAIEDEQLHLRYGIMQEVTVDIKDITGIDRWSTGLSQKTESIKLSLLGHLESQNILLRLGQEYQLNGLYGNTRKFKAIALHVDQPEKFKSTVEEFASIFR